MSAGFSAPRPLDSPVRLPDVDGSTPTTVRVVGIDVTRAIALIGVVTMNFHGYLNPDAGAGGSFVARLFDPWEGVLSTRFAATFVTVAGIGVILLTGRSRRSGDLAALSIDRWRLRRRGLLLLAGGFVLDWIWPGTILFFYGGYFIVGSFLIGLRSRWLIAVGAAAALAAQALQLWSVDRIAKGHSTDWLFSTSAGQSGSPRELLFDLAVNGTHPLLPWLAFFCLGMVLGRALDRWPAWHLRLIALGAAMVAAGYGLSTVLSATAGDDPSSVADRQVAALSRTDPFGRTLLYIVVTIGSSLVAVLLISWIAERFAGSAVVGILARAGQMTLSIYLLHVLLFNLIVNWLGWIRPTGLDTALTFALGFWLVAVVAAAWWHRLIGQGPLERLYRHFGG